MGDRLPQFVFYGVLAVSALAVALAGAMALLEEPQFWTLMMTYTR